MSSRSPALGFIFVTLLIDVIGLGIIIPVLPMLIEELTGSTLSQASQYGGAMLFMYAFMQFIFSPVMGGLSDRFGRRPVLLASLLGFGLDYLFMAFAPSIAWLFLGRTIAGALGASFTTGVAYIADVSPQEKRAQNFGIVGAAFGLGFIIGPLIGGLLGPYGSRIPFMVAAGLSLLNGLYGFFILPESLLPENRRAFEWKRANPVASLLQLKKHPVIMGLVISLVLVYIANHAIHGNWTFYTLEKFKWDSRMVGVSLTVIGIASAIVQGLLIRMIIPKLGKERSIYIGLAFNALGLTLFALATQGWMMFAFTAVFCLGGIAGPALQGIISNHVPANEQGELQGALTSLMGVTSIVGPLIMSNTFAFFTQANTPLYLPGAPMLLGAFLTLIASYLARIELKKHLLPNTD